MKNSGDNNSRPRLLIGNDKGRIYDIPGVEPAGMKAGHYFRLRVSDLVELHPDSELFFLPGRNPVGFSLNSGRFVDFAENPVSSRKEPCYAVAAFLAPGYTASFSPAFKSREGSGKLPLFSYAAVVRYKGRFFASAVKIDREKRQELSGMDMEKLKKNVRQIRSFFPKNRLVKHLERCALTYCCPAGRNFFLKRYEAPLPSSPRCNAFCLGCISFQPGGDIPVTQPRITFVPTPHEIAEVALFHLSDVKDPVVSFGQGCEGEPLMQGKVLLEAVRIIRKNTSKGMINLNTNASKPDDVAALFDAGLDSMRVSINSARKDFYTGYYRPRGYSFDDVVKSIRAAKRSSGFVSVNYLVMPGFTDSAAESKAFRRFLEKAKIDMVQWRNLNYDPELYFRQMGERPLLKELIGVKELILSIKKDFPLLMHGYFNPSKARIRRHTSALARF
jgi:wyosine [tRNA(Phe)-imidazoG37] synthetase (radical SAM superfamily)